jgi:hypothetical protein
LSAIGKRIDAVAGAHVAACLKSAGFRRKGRTFHRLHDDRTDVVNIQGSKWNAGRTGEFTVNVGVFYPAVSRLVDSWTVAGLPTEAECTVRSRLGMLMPGGQDTWWKLRASTSEDKLSATVAEALSDYGLPWLDRMGDMAAVKDEVPALTCAAIALLEAHREEALRHLRRYCEEAPLNADRARQWGIEHGLELPD